MICPSCGVQIPDNNKFCPNCGNAITQSEDQANYAVEPTHDVSENAQEVGAAGIGAAAGTAAGVAGAAGADAAGQAAAQDTIPYAEPADVSIPYAQPAQDSYVSPSQPIPTDATASYGQPADASIPYAQPADAAYAPTGQYGQPTRDVGYGQPAQDPAAYGQYGQPAGNAYGAPQNGYQGASQYQPQQSDGHGLSLGSLICGIASIVLSAFIPVVLGVVGLVLGILGRKKNKSGMAMAGIITSIIGIVISVIIFAVAGVLVAQIVNGELSESDFAPLIEDTSTTTDELDDFNYNLIDTDDAVPSGEAGVPFSESSYPTSCFDAKGNVTCYGLLELDGQELLELLEERGYEYETYGNLWVNGDASSILLISDNLETNFTKQDVAKLTEGGAGMAVLYDLEDLNYSNARQAFDALVNVTVIDKEVLDDELLIAIVKNSAGSEYFVLAVSEENDTDIILLNDDALASGIFNEFWGDDVGSSVREAWDYFMN